MAPVESPPDLLLEPELDAELDAVAAVDVEDEDDASFEMPVPVKVVGIALGGATGDDPSV